MIIAVCFVLILLSTMAAKKASACTTVIVGKKASATGEILVGHNEDSDGRYVMRSHIVRPSDNASSEKVCFEPSLAAVDMPSARVGLLWSEARTYYLDGASFCDFYANLNGVVICSDSCGVSREDAPEITGGIGYGLRRVVAETARSARHALETAIDLVERYGYVGSGRSYHFADKDEAWVLQIARGKSYATARVPDDEVYLIPNHFTIRTPDAGTPNLERLISYAKKRGWYDGAGDFDFARAYQSPEKYRAENNIHRHLRGMEIISGRVMDPDAELPFSVKPSRKVGVEDVKKVLRAHFEGTSDYTARDGTPHIMATRPICDESTLESSVAQIRENPSDILIRRALGKPCMSPYLPWYLGTSAVPEEFGRHDPDQSLSSHFSAPASDFDYEIPGLWRCCTDLQAAADLMYGKADGVRDKIFEFEKKLESDIAAFEDSRSRRYDDFIAAAASGATALLRGIYAGLGVADARVTGQASPGDAMAARLDAGHFKSGISPLEALIGPSYVPFSRWASASSVRFENGAVDVEFAIPPDWKEFVVPCRSDMWILIKTEGDERVAGRAAVDFSEAQGWAVNGV
jgi:hypothetical protein